MTATTERCYLGRLKERHGEDEYDHRVIFKTDADPDAYLEAAASQFYLVTEAEEADNGYYFNNGERHVRTVGFTEVSEKFFNECARLDAVRRV